MNGLNVGSIELLFAVTVASVLGSLHCVGMCGPFVLWASGAGSNVGGKRLRLAAYHLGRLSTYTVGAIAAGAAGYLLSTGGSWVGIQSAAARVAGVAMMMLGLVQLFVWVRQRMGRGRTMTLGTATPQPLPSASATNRSGGWVASRLLTLRPLINGMPATLRAFAVGGLTTLLPCGWLYVFLLVAAGTGTVVSAVAVMFAFWLGSLPALTALALGAFRLAPRVRPALPALGCLLLLGTGLYTATGRAAADMSELTNLAADLNGRAETATPHATPEAALQTLTTQPLPCCDGGD